MSRTILEGISYYSRNLSRVSYLAANGIRDTKFGMASVVKEREGATVLDRSPRYFHMVRRIRSDKCRNNLH